MTFLAETEKQRIKSDWLYKGFTRVDLLDDHDCDVINDELDKLRLKRNESGDWGEYEPYVYPHKESELLGKHFVNPKILEIAEILLECDEVIGLQDWAYFKKPGELGRDMHQNVFYTGCEWNEVLNTSISLEDNDEENGAVWCYPGSHFLPLLPVGNDEKRIKTNPKHWMNERGKPCVMPEGHNFKKEFCNGKKGQIIFIHSHCVHGSEQNTSKTRFRRALLGGYLRKGAHFNKGNHMKREAIDVYKLKEYYWNG